MHWINFPLLFIMILSGIRIYWNDSDNAHLHAHAVYRIGFGSHTLLRIFPEPVANALNIPWHVTQGMGDHFFFMWLFAINGFAYVAYSLVSGEWRFLLPRRGSLREAWRVILVSLRLRRELPSKNKYNGAQKIAYSTVIAMGAGSLITGLGIYKPTQLHYLTTMLGGYEWARWEHFWLTMGFCLFFLVHVVPGDYWRKTEEDIVAWQWRVCLGCFDSKIVSIGDLIRYRGMHFLVCVVVNHVPNILLQWPSQLVIQQ